MHDWWSTCYFRDTRLESALGRFEAELIIWYGRKDSELKGDLNWGKAMCDALRDLVPFIQFKKREKYSWRSVTFSKVASFSLQIY